MKRLPRLEYRQRKDGSWFWHKRHANGRITTDAQGYDTKAGVVRAIYGDLLSSLLLCGFTGYSMKDLKKIVPVHDFTEKK